MTMKVGLERGYALGMFFRLLRNLAGWDDGLERVDEFCFVAVIVCRLALKFGMPVEGCRRRR